MLTDKRRKGTSGKMVRGEMVNPDQAQLTISPRTISLFHR
jgi:hypothetical protein